MFRDLLLKTRSYRNFDNTVRYTQEDMRQLIELTRYTPSTANRQPVKYAYVCDDESCRAVFPLLGWAGYLTEKPPYDGNLPTAYILMCYDTQISEQSPEIDFGICAQTIVLGAMERGIGACMIGSFKKPEAAKIFGLPENIVPRLIIALGKPYEKIVLTDALDGDIKYYRDADKTHYVPKRTLEDIIINQR